MEGLNTQKAHVLSHLKGKGYITSLEAINDYGATRLSSIIHTLRHKDGYIIETRRMTGLNRYGHACNYAKYVLKGERHE